MEISSPRTLTAFVDEAGVHGALPAVSLLLSLDNLPIRLEFRQILFVLVMSLPTLSPIESR